MRRWALVLLAGLAAACGDDGGSGTERSTVVVADDLAAGDVYEQGGASLTVHGAERRGDLVLVDVEACIEAGGPAGIPIEAQAWQLRIDGTPEALDRVVLDDPPPQARPTWPARAAVAPGECLRGKVPFETDGDPAEVVFTQLGQPVSWMMG
jgi:hypothetical protein